MKWFSGTIAEAISFAQGRKATFVAYVEGRCEKSKMMTSIFDDREVCNNLECSRFVCVNIEGDSIGYKQLVEIYKKVPIPSLFFISHSGVPLDIVVGELFDDAFELKEAVLVATIKCNQLNASQGPPRADVPHDKILEERRQQIDQILESRKKEREGNTSTKQPMQKENAGGEVKKQSKDEQKLMKKDLDLKKMVEEREKEKIAEAKERQRILDQIAQDRAERAERMRPVNVPSKKEVKSSPPANGATQSSQARIQFRLPTGESRSSMFPNDTKLSQIRDYIDSNLELSYRDYRLATTFPRREFTIDDNGSTLEELSLVPNAVILILPNTSSRVNPYTKSWIKIMTDLVYDLLQPLYSLSNYVRGLIFRPREAQGPSSSSPSSEQPTQSPSNQQGQTKTVRKVGNVYSLKDIRDGNDENNTWNGNSTQQM